MTDFTTNIDMNVRMMNEKLRVDRNFDILQRDVLIGGKRTHFYFIDGFVQEETIEKLVQFFYSLKESDMELFRDAAHCPLSLCRLLAHQERQQKRKVC